MLLVLLLAAFSSSISGALSSSSSSSSSSPYSSEEGGYPSPSSDLMMAETCSVCACMSVENVLYVNCEKITVYRPTQLVPPASQLYHLNFQNNALIVLYPNSFVNFSHAVSLQLGNNKLQSVEGGAFAGLSALKQLHLNNNELTGLRADTFQGIESLEYLQADYNLIRYIERGAFNKLHRLKVLILNDNLVQALPDNIFRFASLTHLDIRGNRIQKLPYLGVLEHIGRIVELQLDDNPWNCTCDLAPLKAWLENMPYSIFIGEAVCETPSDLYGRLLKETNKQELCPTGTGSDFDVRMPPPAGAHPENRLSPSDMSPTTTPPAAGAGAGPGPGATKASKTTGDPSNKIYGNGIVAAGLPPFGRNTQIVSFQTRTPPLACPQPCACKAHQSDFGVSLTCQEQRIRSVGDLVPKPPNAKKLHLSGNAIRDVAPADFRGFEGLDLLHLGSNQIAAVPKGAFANLTNLRRLFLNGNQLEQLHPDMFLGLTNLQYLHLEYNAIKEILAGTFGSMPNLQLLYLNNNVLRSLPVYVFAGVPLARLSLKNNHFMTLPVSGVLDQLRSLVHVDLDGNPWECSCDLVALKLWLEKLGRGVASSDVRCASPVQFANVELLLLKNEILCPKLVQQGAPAPHRPPFAFTSATPLLLVTSVSPGSSAAGGGGGGGGVGRAPPGGPVPLSIMILSILVVLILTVFVAFCLLVFVLRRNKKPAGGDGRGGGGGGEGGGHRHDGSSMSLHLRRHGRHKSGKKGSGLPGDDLGGEPFIPQTIEHHVGKSSHTCGMATMFGRSSLSSPGGSSSCTSTSADSSDGGFKFGVGGCGGSSSSSRQNKEKEAAEAAALQAMATLERQKRLSTIDELEEFLPGGRGGGGLDSSGMFLQCGFLDGKGRDFVGSMHGGGVGGGGMMMGGGGGPMGGFGGSLGGLGGMGGVGGGGMGSMCGGGMGGGFEIRYPERPPSMASDGGKRTNSNKNKVSLIGGNHSKMVVEQRRATEYYELKAKLQGTTPDYLQVLEEQTALSKM